MQWYIFSSFPEPDLLTLVAPLSREEGDGFLTCSGNFSQEIFTTLSDRAERWGLPLQRLAPALNHRTLRLH